MNDPVELTSQDEKNINDVARVIHDYAISKGWWLAPRNDGEILALMHSEISEALEFLRHGNPPSDHVPEISGVAEEMADVVIRVMDYCHARDINIGKAIAAKHKFNMSRGFKHGGKKF